MSGVLEIDEEQERIEEERIESQQTELMMKMTEMEQELNDCRDQNDLLMTVLEKEKSLSQRYRSKNQHLYGYNPHPSYSQRYRGERFILGGEDAEEDEELERKPRRSFWSRAFTSDSSGPTAPPTPPEQPSELVDELNNLLVSKDAEVQTLRDELKSVKRRSKAHNSKIGGFEQMIDELKQQQDKMQSEWSVTRRKYEKHIDYLTKQKEKLESKLGKQKKWKKGKKSVGDYNKEKELLELAFAEQIEKMKIKHELEMKKRELLQEESEKLSKLKKIKEGGLSGGWKGFLYGNSLILVVLLFLYFIYMSVRSSPVRRNSVSRVYT